MGLLHSLLESVGLTTAGRARVQTERADAATRRVTELKGAIAQARDDAARWKTRARELTEELARAGKAAERLPKVERELQQWKARDEKHVAQLADVRERMVRAERAAALSQEHLTATETKLDVIEAALNVLDRRTRTPL